MARTAEATGLHRFTVDEDHRMADAGILAEDDRVELIYGVIREMSPRTDRIPSLRHGCFDCSSMAWLGARERTSKPPSVS